MDDLIVVRSQTKRLAKLVRYTPDGVVVDGYDDAAKFTWEARPVDCFEALAMELENLARDPNACVIRGAIKDQARQKKVVNRRQHRGKDGVDGDWENHRPGRRWVAFDIDKLPLPEDLRPADMLMPVLAKGIAAFARGRLPEEFRDAACAFHFSGSAGLHGWDKVSLHLWFWLDRPVFDLSWRAWAKGKGVDESLFKAVQAHYTADPVFEDGLDPLAGVRFGVLDGEPEVVAPLSLQDFDDWEARNARQVALKAADIDAKKAAIVRVPEQSASALRKYALQALAGAVGDILVAVEGTRHGTLTAKAHKLGGLVQDGALEEFEVLAALDDAIVETFPGNRHASSKRTARDLLAIGMTKPCDLSGIGRRAGKAAHLRVVPAEAGDDVPTPEPGSSAAKKKAPAKHKGIEWVDLGPKGEILSTAPNLAALLDSMGYRPRRNLMNHQTEWIGAPSDIALECLQAAMASVVIDEATRNDWKLATEKFWMHLGAVEARDAFHPVVDWAKSKPWDGRSRFRDLFASITPSERCLEFTGLMFVQLEKWLIAGGHCLALGSNRPEGVAVQGVLVLQGKQDMGKTRWFQSLVADPSWLADGVTLHADQTDSIIGATSTFLCELGELDGTTRKSDVAMLKSFLTRSTDKYRAAYGRKQEVYPRRTLFGATVNPEEFLVDPTGNRRYWMMPANSVNADHGVDIQQLWAEAMHRAKAGETYWMPSEWKEKQLELARRFDIRSEWADDFFHRFRLPTGSETGAMMRVGDIRERIYPERRWTQAEMRSFSVFLRSIDAKMTLRNGVMHACVMSW
jgi:hypothetical protein